jgi:hypothetical protein
MPRSLGRENSLQKRTLLSELHASTTITLHSDDRRHQLQDTFDRQLLFRS